jgi:hypothetical protein
MVLREKLKSIKMTKAENVVTYQEVLMLKCCYSKASISQTLGETTHYGVDDLVPSASSSFSSSKDIYTASLSKK